jgi:hypothetical protein
VRHRTSAARTRRAVGLRIEALGETAQHDGRAGVPTERAAAAQLLGPLGDDLAGKCFGEWDGVHVSDT